MSLRLPLLCLSFLFLPFCLFAQADAIYSVKNGIVSFNSVAPQEMIYASSKKLQGVIDLQKKTFVFKIGIASFSGFNSALQQVHFNENYMETAIFPEATFIGKVIEEADISKDGEYAIRAKGKLKIHGLEQERIIKVHIITKGGQIVVKSDFVVELSDHNIKIPKIVYDKVAPDIHVSVNATFAPNH